MLRIGGIGIKDHHRYQITICKGFLRIFLKAIRATKRELLKEFLLGLNSPRNVNFLKIFSKEE